MDHLLQNDLNHYFHVYQANIADVVALLTVEQQEELTEQLELLRHAILTRLNQDAL